MTQHDDFTAEPRDAFRRRRRTVPLIQWLTAGHAAGFVVAASWAFGGQADWVRPGLTAWGCLGVILCLAAVLRPGTDALNWRRLLLWAAPIIAVNVLVLVSGLNPSLREIRSGEDTLLAVFGGNPHWPSSARPDLARTALLQFDVVWLSCFNLTVLVTRRRVLRLLLAIMAGNALVLAIFGTVQKFSGATGLFFGAVPTPQKYFFASFVYHNHWGAFALLMIAVALALAHHYLRRHRSRDVFHSPAGMGVLVILVIAATIPLSASRSSTILAVVLLGGTCLRALVSQVQRRRHYNESIVPVVALVTVAGGLALAAVWYVARDTIRNRARMTIEQLTAARTSDRPDQRVELYRDTLHMGLDKPWFGWGMASYPYVFTVYNTRPPIPHFPVFYHDAHSDWLQSFAEHGIIGTLLFAAAALLPLGVVMRRRPLSPVSTYCFAGCGILLVYALFEFPFGNYAVVLAWWAVFYCGVQYARLTAGRATESDRAPGASGEAEHAE